MTVTADPADQADQADQSGTTEPAGSRPVERPSFRSDIDGLRAVAIVVVVLFHAHIRGFDGGFVGVDVFFVSPGS